MDEMNNTEPQREISVQGQPQAPRKSKKVWWVVGLVIVLLVVGGGWYYRTHFCDFNPCLMPPVSECPYDDPDWQFHSKDVGLCAAIKYICPEGTKHFSDNRCGCGCVTMDEVDTSNWLMYSNEEYGFEFKYPNEYEQLSTPDTNYWRRSGIYSEGQGVKYYSTIEPYITLSAFFIPENSAQSIFVRVFDLDDYTFADVPSGNEYGFNQDTSTWWKNFVGQGEQSAELNNFDTIEIIPKAISDTSKSLQPTFDRIRI